MDERLRDAIVRLAGGEDTLRLLRENVVYERSYRQLAEDRGVHRSTIKRRCDAMADRLIDAGVYAELVLENRVA